MSYTRLASFSPPCQLLTVFTACNVFYGAVRGPPIIRVNLFPTWCRGNAPQEYQYLHPTWLLQLLGTANCISTPSPYISMGQDPRAAPNRQGMGCVGLGRIRQDILEELLPSRRGREWPFRSRTTHFPAHYQSKEQFLRSASLDRHIEDASASNRCGTSTSYGCHPVSTQTSGRCVPTYPYSIIGCL